MNIRLLKSQDISALEEYLAPHQPECMFICSNLKVAGIEYGGSDFEGEYFGYFDMNDQLQGVIVHYGNGKMMMHARDHDILENLTLHLKKNIRRPIAGVLGPNLQAARVIEILELSQQSFSINSNEGLYSLNLSELPLPLIEKNCQVISAVQASEEVLMAWMYWL